MRRIFLFAANSQLLYAFSLFCFCLFTFPYSWAIAIAIPFHCVTFSILCAVYHWMCRIFSILPVSCHTMAVPLLKKTVRSFVLFGIRATFYVTRITCIVFVFHLLSSFHGNRLSSANTHRTQSNALGLLHTHSFRSLASSLTHSVFYCWCVCVGVTFVRFFFEIVRTCILLWKIWRSTSSFFSALSIQYYSNYIFFVFFFSHCDWVGAMLSVMLLVFFYMYSHLSCAFFSVAVVVVVAAVAVNASHALFLRVRIVCMEKIKKAEKNAYDISVVCVFLY